MSRLLAASELIVEHLRAKLTTVPVANIRAAIDFQWVITNPISPSIAVIFYDDVPVSSSRDGTSITSDQYWLVLVTVRNVRDIGISCLQNTGEIGESMLIALQGFVPSKLHSPLIRTRCPYRKTTRYELDKKNDGYIHLPFMFTCKIVTNSTP